MSDNLNTTVRIDTEVTGVASSAGQLNRVTDLVDDLRRAGGYTEEQLRGLYRELSKLERSSAGGIRKDTTAVQQLRSHLQKATKDLQEFAAARALGGSTTPQADSLVKMTDSRATGILAADQASRVNAVSTAKAFKAAQADELAILQQSRKEKRAILRQAEADHARLIQESGNKITAEERKASLQRVLIARRETQEVREEIRKLAAAREQATRMQTPTVTPGHKALDARASVIGGRNYNNASVQIDGAISQRAKESSDFSKQLRADMEARARAEDKAAKATAKSTQVNMKSDMSIRQLAESNGGLRYAMYDVARTAGMISAAITGLGVAAVATAASFESSFTQVERTTMASDQALGQLYTDLMKLTQDTPQSWGFVTEVASIGAQLDIATESLGMFTEQTTRFSSVTGISAETSAMAFGSLGQLLKLSASEFESLGSSIAYVGVNSVATDEEIIKMSQRLAASAENAGLTAQETIALSGAFASLRIAPERAQGVMEVYFKVLNSAIAEGGDRLTAFAKVSGMTTDEVARMVETDPTSYFRALSQGLSSLDPVSMTNALSDLGLSGIRAGEVFTRVSGNLEVFDQALVDSNKAWEDGTHLSEAYGLVVDDLASKWTIFKNAIAEFANTVGTNLTPILKGVLDVASYVVQSISTFLNHPVGKFVSSLGIVIGAFVALGAAIVAGLALSLASMAAVSFAARELGLSSTTAAISMAGLRAAISGVGQQALFSAGALRVFKVALASTGIGLAVVAVGALAAAFMNLEHPANAASASFEKLFGDGAGLQGAITEDAKAFQEANFQLGDSFIALKHGIDPTVTSVEKHSTAMQTAADLLGVTLEPIEDVTGAYDDQTRVIGDNTIAWMKNALVMSEAFQKHMDNDKFVADFKRLGLSVDQVLEAAAQGGEQGVYDLYARATAANGKGGELLSNGWGQFWGRFGRVLTATGTMISNWWDATINFDFTRATQSIIAGSLGIAGAINSTVYNIASTDLAKAATDVVNQVGFMEDAFEDLNGVYDDENTENLDDTADAAKKAAQEVYTLVDYANDLASVWDRAFDIRFSGEQTMDAITSSLQDIRKASEDAAKKIRDLKNDISGMSSDIKIQEYFLSIAVEYGDTKRAEAIEANLAKLRAELADKTLELQEQQDKASMSLVGNSEAAIDNRNTIQSLVQSYQAHVQALAASGMEQDELAVKTEQLRQDFIKQATQLGFSRVEVQKYAVAFDDVSKAIALVPRKITVTASADPAIQAFNELQAAANKASGAVTGLKNNLGSGMSSGGINTNPIRNAGFEAEAAMLRKKLMDAAFAVGAAKGAALAPYTESGLRARLNHLAALGFASGGYTGRGGMYDPAGIVHRGEYVIPKKDVNQATGRPHADAMGRHVSGLPSRATAPAASSASGGSNVVSLSAGTIQALAHSVSKVLVLDGKVLADSSTNQFHNGTVVGAY